MTDKRESMTEKQKSSEILGVECGNLFLKKVIRKFRPRIFFRPPKLGAKFPLMRYFAKHKSTTFYSFSGKTLKICSVRTSSNFHQFKKLRWQNSWNSILGAESVSRSTYTSVEMTAPMAYSSIHDRQVQACPLVDQTRFKFADVSYSESVNFLLQYTPDAIVDRFRSGEFDGYAVEGMKMGTFRSRKTTVSRARCTSAPSCWKTKPTLGYSEYVRQ